MSSENDTQRNKDLVVVAIGGNSLSLPGQVGTLTEQRENATSTCRAVAAMVAKGYRVVLTHGNGPQVGNVLWRVELADHMVYRLPLDVCGADTQGSIGYMLQQILGDELRRQEVDDRVATVVTQVIVDPSDPDFDTPTKPVGPFMSEDIARSQESLGWRMLRVDSRGYRRVVPSPKPIAIVEIDAIQAVIDAGVLCICAGGGGVPIHREGNLSAGLAAVIDKDRASALLANTLGATRMVISTGIPQVCLDFDTPEQRPVHDLTVEQAQSHLKDGHFPPGSMGPKVSAALIYLEAGGREVLITDPDHLAAALDGDAGTRVVWR